MSLMSFFTQPHSLVVDYILTGFEYFGYLLVTGIVMNMLGMGKAFDYLIKLFAEVLGYTIGFVVRRTYRYLIKPLFRKLFARKVTSLSNSGANL